MIEPSAPVIDEHFDRPTKSNRVDIRQLVSEPLPAEPAEQVRRDSQTTGRTGHFGRTLSLISCGQIGMAIVSVGAIWLSLLVFPGANESLLIAITLLLTVRLVYVLTRGPEPVLTRFLVRKTVRRTLVDEAKISTGVFAAAFLLGGALSPKELITFAIANAALQIGHLGYSRIVLRQLAQQTQRQPRSIRTSRTAIVIGSGAQATAAADLILDSPELDTKLIGFLDWRRADLWRYRDIPLIGHPDRLAEIIAGGQVDAILIAVEPCDLVATQSILAKAEEMGVNSYLLSEIHSPDVAVLRPEFLGGKPALVWRHVKESRTAIFTKLFLDRLGGLLALIVASPIMLATALAVKIDSRGPVFFKQIRCGLNGRTFELYKFRTMVADAEQKKADLLNQNEMSGPVFKLRCDPRMTRVGRLMRKYSIDELPQLFNIIKGDMSLVGPRPPLPKEVVKYEPWQRRKLSIKPGLTCISQVSARNSIYFEQWMRMDLEYIDHWSLWLDAKILIRTIPTVLKGTGM